MLAKTELPTVDERCETCRYWDAEDPDEAGDDLARGECRRHPPHPNIIANLAVLLNLRDMQRENYPYSEDIYSPYDDVPIPDSEAGERTLPLDEETDHRAVWPVTWACNWCGEWRAKAQHNPTPPDPSE